MTTFVALLRGINLGNRRLSMEELRGHFGSLGLEGVATFIASGNVVLSYDGSDAEALEVEIEEHLRRALGYEVDTFLRSLERLSQIVDREGEGEVEGFKAHVIFLKEAVDPGVLGSLKTLETPDDRFRAQGREVVWLRRGGLSDSSIETRHLQQALGGRTSTTRTLNTLRRMVGKFGA